MAWVSNVPAALIDNQPLMKNYRSPCKSKKNPRYDFTFPIMPGLNYRNATMKMRMTVDENIKQAIQKNPQTAFSMLLREYQKPVYWHIRRLVVNHDDAQDAAQETFIRIYRSSWQLAKIKSLRAWIYKIATNEALRILERRHPESVSEENAFDAYADEHVDLSRKTGILFQKAMLSLPAKQQLAFNLRYYDEMSCCDILARNFW